MPQCVANEASVLEIDFGAAEVVKGKCEVLSHIRTCAGGRAGDRAAHSSQRIEVAGYALKAVPGSRIEVSCKMLDGRRTCSLFEYQCGSNRYVFQLLQGHLHITSYRHKFKTKRVVLLMAKSWTDIELQFSDKGLLVFLGKEFVCLLPLHYGHNTGIMLFGETGKETDKHIRPCNGVLIESLRVVEEI